MKQPIKVMIVEDSPTVRELLTHIVASDPRFEIVALADSGEKALKLLVKANPDVITMDIRLPGMDGFETTQRIMQTQPTPIVVVAASVESDDLKISMNALSAGALVVIEKPNAFSNEAYEKVSRHLLNQLKIMSEVKVVRQRWPRPLALSNRKKEPKPGGNIIKKDFSRTKFQMLGIVASTGGPNAFCEVLGHLPENFPLPIVMVQHIMPSFLEGFVGWLDSILPFSVLMVDALTRPLPGCVYIASPDCHLEIQNGFLLPGQGPMIHHQRPSGTVTFRSMAKYYKQNCIGVLLTGMGEDGAEGLLEIKNAGGYTIAEAESTSVVFGMPATAIRMGAACDILPLDEVAPKLIQMLQTNGGFL